MDKVEEETLGPYGRCPHCYGNSLDGSIRERRPSGYTVCGGCDRKSKSVEWHAVAESVNDGNRRGHLDELAKEWAKIAQVPPTAEYHGMWWRIAMNSNADAISNRGNHESACIIYRAIIADARAEAETT